MTDKKTEALKLALEALELEDMACRYEKDQTPEHIAKAITAIREALAEQQASKPWVVLADDEIEELANDFEEGYVFRYRRFTRAIEAKLKEKNA